MKHDASTLGIHAIAGLLVIMLAWFGYHYGIQRPHEVARRVAMLQSEAVQLETVAAHRPKVLQESVGKQQESIADVVEQPQTLTPTSVLQQIQGLAQSVGLTIDRSEPLGFQPEISVGWRFRISGMGTFVGIIDYCEELDTLPFAVEITNLRLERLGGNTVRWQLDGATVAVRPAE